MKPLSDFDAIDAQMPALLRWLHAAIASQIDPTTRDAFEEQEVVVVGWSARKGRMDATMYSKTREGGFDDFEIPPDGWCVPWNDDEQGGPPMQPKGHAEMETIAREQVRYMRATQPPTGIGGRLIICELTRHSIAIMSTDLEASPALRHAASLS